MIFKKAVWFVAGVMVGCCFTFNAQAQKYYFQHYDSNDGLIQSQVTAICQDLNKQIWLTTLGGINCFDSKQFNAFTIEEGLPQNAFFSLLKDKKGKIWAGSSKGITEFSDNGIKNYAYKASKNYKITRQLLCDKQNNIWALRGSRLYKLVN